MLYAFGYFIGFETARTIMQRLAIPDKGCDVHQLYFPINDWLAKQGKTKPLVGPIRHPHSGFQPIRGMHGLLLVTRFERRFEDQPLADIENDSDRQVKDWLIQESGAKESDLSWHSCLDETGLADNGTMPFRNDFAGKESRYRLKPDQIGRYIRSGKGWPAFLEEMRENGEHVQQLE
ncbi:hypothetical protein HGRIS_010418 [Hohenbuehelia grisea]|uniref:Uncharacterized protein n=1 Tax=Hohenbuehelia grisea TaxID=104357 RepID=A0ABR3J4P2_9AGAR